MIMLVLTHQLQLQSLRGYTKANNSCRKFCHRYTGILKARHRCCCSYLLLIACPIFFWHLYRKWSADINTFFLNTSTFRSKLTWRWASAHFSHLLHLKRSSLRGGTIPLNSSLTNRIKNISVVSVLWPPLDTGRRYFLTLHFLQYW